MTKIYGYPDKVYASVEIPFNRGRNTVKIEFTGGCTDRKIYRPATFKTSNPVVQDIIEKSKLFGSTITLIRTFGPAPVKKPKNDPNPVKEPELTNKPPVMSGENPKNDPNPVEEPELTQKDGEFPDLRTWEEVAAKLKSLGAKATDLRTRAAAQKFASAQGLSFPNFTFED